MKWFLSLCYQTVVVDIADDDVGLALISSLMPSLATLQTHV